jgi:DHA2 family multidrug resistance protein
LFYQELLGYTALNAGWAVSPRGIGAIVAMPIIGLLTTRLDTRWLIASGFLVFAICSLWFGEANLAISQWTFLWAILLSGFGSGMVFVPLSTTAMGTIANEQMGNASGLYNLLRNVGGSVGISIVNTIVSRHEQLHRNELVHSLAPTNRLVDQRLSALHQLLTRTNAAGPALATSGAYKMLEHTLTAQARMWAYVDDFRYIALVCFACLPLVWLLKRAKPRKGAAAAAH